MSRKNISLSDPVVERAKAIIDARGFSGLSELLATLIREEYERRAPPNLPPALHEGIINYGAKPKSKRRK